jgi:uncharacterized protein (DUF983 family)
MHARKLTTIAGGESGRAAFPLAGHGLAGGLPREGDVTAFFVIIVYHPGFLLMLMHQLERGITLALVLLLVLVLLVLLVLVLVLVLLVLVLLLQARTSVRGQHVCLILRSLWW